MFIIVPALVLAACQPSTQGNIALVNGTLIDGTGSDPLADAVLIIQDGRITAAGPRSAVFIPEGAQVIDVQGATILPGFINAHVHSAYSMDNLAAWAQAGVTTVRDLRARSVPPPYSIREQAEKDARYARLVAVGVFITAPGGYPIEPWGLDAITVTSPDEARQAVKDMLDQGANVIKISLESGRIFEETIPILAPEEVAVIVETAHRRGTRVSAHVSISADLEKAINGGVDDIAHMVTDPLPQDLISRMVADDIYWEPTLELWKNVQHGLDQHVVKNLGLFVSAGGKVALGTDYAGYTTPFQMGMPIHEMEWMEEAGMTPMQIIVAGTRHAAHVCNLEDELGTLEVGKIADVLVIRGDPLQDIHALSNVVWVIHKGVVIRSPNP